MKKAILLILLGSTLLASSTFADTFTVTTTNDSGAGSLRQAITDANNHAGPDKIVFNITTGSAPWTIQPTYPLTNVTGDYTHIDGTTQTGYAANAPVIVINGTNAGLEGNGIVIMAAHCTIEGLVINGFNLCGINLSAGNAHYTHIKNNFLGTDAAGTIASRNSNSGVSIQTGSSNNIIEGNLISGNTAHGVVVESNNNVVRGNYIGTNAAGTAAIANNMGIYLRDNAQLNTIGGPTAAERNVIAGNARDGINLQTSSSNEIAGNYIGLGASGNALGNSGYGINIRSGSQSNTIGPNNVIAYNGSPESSPPGGGVIINPETIDAILYNTITQNSMFSNYGKGIELVGSANAYLPYPHINSLSYSSGTLSLSGTAPANAIIEIFLGDDCEGRTYEASTTSEAGGNWSWSGTISGLSSGGLVTCTATDSQGNTSEFTPCATVEAPTTTTTTSSTTTTTAAETTATTTTTTTLPPGTEISNPTVNITPPVASQPAFINLDFQASESGTADFALYLAEGDTLTEVYRTRVPVEQNQNTLSTALSYYGGVDLPRGIYIYRLFYKGQTRSGKIHYIPKKP